MKTSFAIQATRSANQARSPNPSPRSPTDAGPPPPRPGVLAGRPGAGPTRWTAAGLLQARPRLEGPRQEPRPLVQPGRSDARPPCAGVPPGRVPRTPPLPGADEGTRVDPRHERHAQD